MSVRGVLTGQKEAVSGMSLVVRQQRARIRARIARAQKDLKDLQAKCPHVNHSKKFVGDEWRYSCPDCGKQWFGQMQWFRGSV
jgi:transposase-like protein